MNGIYTQLAKACYDDNVEEVKKILNTHKNLDLNLPIHSYSGKRGSGTPLILTASKEIGKLLLRYGADINYIYSINKFTKITALDSAIKELTKLKAKKNKKFKKMVKEYIEFLKNNGAKTYEELKKEK
jgi:predicted HTH transcriptional regulator